MAERVCVCVRERERRERGEREPRGIFKRTFCVERATKRSFFFVWPLQRCKLRSAREQNRFCPFHRKKMPCCRKKEAATNFRELEFWAFVTFGFFTFGDSPRFLSSSLPFSETVKGDEKSQRGVLSFFPFSLLLSLSLLSLLLSGCKNGWRKKWQLGYKSQG